VNYRRAQRIQAQGRLLCGTEPADNVTVLLVDVDLGTDDEIDRKLANEDGVFLVDGVKAKTTAMEPSVKIYHSCDIYSTCPRLWRIRVPQKYATLVEPYIAIDPIRTFHFGTLNLQVRIPDEIEECVPEQRIPPVVIPVPIAAPGPVVAPAPVPYPIPAPVEAPAPQLGPYG